jgi:hypothetical protein
VDGAKVTELQAAITSQQKAYADADAEMLKIEQRFNNPDIVKHCKPPRWIAIRHATMARHGAHPSPTGVWNRPATSAPTTRAASWKNWGEELSEPRYGAITVVTRSAKPEYHVGFYTGMSEKNVADGVEEVEVKGKDGTITKKTKKKFRKVKMVRLLSGNFSRMVRDFPAGRWTRPTIQPCIWYRTAGPPKRKT